MVPNQKKKIGNKTNNIIQILPNKNTGHGGNDNQNRENKNTRIDCTKHGQYNIDNFYTSNQKIYKH